MITKTNLLRTAALCIALCAAPLSIHALTVQEVTEFIKAEEQNIAAAMEKLAVEAKNLMQQVDPEDMECVNAQFNAIRIGAKELLVRAKATYWWDTATIDALREEIKVYNDIIIPEMQSTLTTFDIAKAFSKDSAFHKYVPVKWVRAFFDISHAEIDLYYKQQSLDNLNSMCDFVKNLFSSSSYNDAWQVVIAPDTLLGKAEILWNYHKSAVAGTAIIATAVTACIAYRNKIKAGLNRLFGSSVETENNNDPACA